MLSYVFLTDIGDSVRYNLMQHIAAPMTEREPHHPASSELPPELVAAIADVDYACLTIGTDAGTALLVKAPTSDIDSARGRIPIQLNHELYDHPSSPVIRLALRIYDQPATPLAMETFINVADDAQHADYAALADQDEIALFFLDEQLQQRLTKRISHSGRDVVPQVLTAAEQLLARIPPEQFNFERAKQAIMEATRL